MSKAQVVSGDFTISVVVFIAILIMVLPLWDYVENQVVDNEERKDIESSLLIMSDVLIKSPGLPKNWSSTNAISVGLADSESILNLTKVLALIDMDYDKARELLGVKRYGTHILLKDINGYNITSGVCNSPIAYFSVNQEDLKPVIANSGIVWDYYYGGSGSPDQYDSRNFYSAAKADAFNAMLSNRSIYQVFIIEDSELTEGEVNIAELKDFLDMGGIAIVEGDATIIKDSFDMHAEQGSDREGTVLQSGFVLADAGSSATFDNADWAFYQDPGDKTLQRLIADTGDSSDAIVGYWNYGYGRIYYISDINATVGGSPLEFNIIGEKLEFGIPPNGYMVSKAQRLVLLDKENKIVTNMNVVLWK